MQRLPTPSLMSNNGNVQALTLNSQPMIVLLDLHEGTVSDCDVKCKGISGWSQILPRVPLIVIFALIKEDANKLFALPEMIELNNWVYLCI